MSRVGRALLVTGHPGVVRDHAEAARTFYDGLTSILTECRLDVLEIDPAPACETLEGVQVLVGHSLGARSVLAWYNPQIHEQIAGIVVFDPSDLDWEIWQGLTVRRRAFISSEGGQPWCRNNWSHATRLADGHYFLRSLALISHELRGFRPGA